MCSRFSYPNNKCEDCIFNQLSHRLRAKMLVDPCSGSKAWKAPDQHIGGLFAESNLKEREQK
jgi:hypothetical protein